MPTDKEFVRVLIKRGVVLSLLWLFGIGSLVAVLSGLRARRLIKASNAQLQGSVGVWWCLIVGSIGLVFWLPIIAIGIFNNLK